MISGKTEDKILTLLSRVDIPSEGKEILDDILATGSIDYSNLIYRSYINRVDMIVYYNIQKLQIGHRLLPKILKVFRKTFYYNNFRLKYMEEEFWKITNLLNEKGVKYAAIKGLILNKLIFRDNQGTYFRDFNDLDFLVLRSELNLVKEILYSLGYVQGEYDVGNDEIRVIDRKKILEYNIRSHQTAPFLKKIFVQGGLPIVVEVDINLTIFSGGNENDRIGMDEILSTRRKLVENDAQYVWHLNVGEMLIQLVYHLYRETTYEVKINEKDDITLQKFVDIREFFLKYIEEEQYCSIVNLIKRAEMEHETCWIMEYILELFSDKKVEEFLQLLNEKNVQRKQA